MKTDDDARLLQDLTAECAVCDDVGMVVGAVAVLRVDGTADEREVLRLIPSRHGEDLTVLLHEEGDNGSGSGSVGSTRQVTPDAYRPSGLHASLWT